MLNEARLCFQSAEVMGMIFMRTVLEIALDENEQLKRIIEESTDE